jgi:hypothetical protein
MTRLALTLLPLFVALPTSASEIVFRGTMRTTIDYYDYCGGPMAGELRYIARRAYDVAAMVIFSDRSSDGDFAESNPFHLVIAPSGYALGDGALSITSAAVATTTKGPVMLQF